MTDEDAKLAALLRAPDRPEDLSFVDSVIREVAIDERLRAAKAASWKQFIADAGATAAVVAAAALLRQAPGGTGLTSVVLLMLVASWIVMIRPQRPATV